LITEYLYIGSTNFDSDGIPLEIGNLSKLVEFDCSYSLFYGPLSGEIFSNMPNLKTLVLSGNGYSSSVPDEIAMLPELQYLSIEEAFLQGDLSFVEKMPKIVELRLDFNPGLTGDIPATIAVANTLETLSATSCGLTGSIPVEIGMLKNVKNLFLYGNHLEGEIPTELGKLSRMETFEVELNDITGLMPDELCKLTLPGEGWLKTLEADCNGQVKCSCCTACFGPPNSSDQG
jgi:Leucine-rich repeat (LRR) protein